MNTADVVVVGLGAAGSAALFHLAKRGVRVLGLDRFVPPHAMGSTHGDSRIIRKAYFEGEAYLPLLKRAFALWEELEKVTQQTLITRCGCLNIASASSPRIAAARRSAEIGDVEVVHMTPEAVRSAFPAYHLREHEVALFEPGAGAIHPELCVATHLSQACAHGATVFLKEPALSWNLVPGGVVVRSNTRTFHAGKMVLTVGAWLRTQLQDASPPVKVERVMNAWYSTTGSYFDPRHCPTFIWEYAENARASYGFPDLGQGMKVGLHHRGHHVDSPAEIDRTIQPHEIRELHTLMSQLFPEKLRQCTYASTCMYTNTPDKHYLIDYLQGNERRVAVGSACSGHGFKSSAAVGEVLADLAMDQAPSTHIAPFRWRWPQA